MVNQSEALEVLEAYRRRRQEEARQADQEAGKWIAGYVICALQLPLHLRNVVDVLRGDEGNSHIEQGLIDFAFGQGESRIVTSMDDVREQVIGGINQYLALKPEDQDQFRRDFNLRRQQASRK